MKNETIIIVLPLPNKVLSPNFIVGSIGGRIMKASASGKYRRLAKEVVEAEKIESLPWKKIKVSADFHYKTKRKRDQDNAMGSLKAVYDGIVDAGIVEDDDYEHMERGIPKFHDNSRKVCPMVILTIERLE